MTTQTLPTTETIAQMLAVTDAQVAEMRDKLMGLKINGLSDKAGYQIVSTERKKVKAMRVALDKQRVSLNEDARNWINTVNGEAKRLTKALEEIEDHLEAQEKAYDDAKKEIALEAVRQAKAKLQGRVDAMTKVKGPIDIEALQTLSDDEFADLLTRSTHTFEQAEAARIEREENDRKAREEQEAKAAIGRGRAAELAQFGDIVSPDEAARWDEAVFAIRREEAEAQYLQRKADAEAANARADRLKDLEEKLKECRNSMEAHTNHLETLKKMELA